MFSKCFVSYIPLQSHHLGLIDTKVSTDTKSGMFPLNHVIQTFFKKRATNRILIIKKCY